MRRRVVGGAVAAALTVATMGWVVSDQRSEGSGERSGNPTSTVSGTVTGGGLGEDPRDAAATVPPSTVDPATLVQLDDVWLLDGGDGSYDWGIVLQGGAGARRDIDVTVRLEDSTGSVVFTATEELSVLAPRQRTALGGTAGSLPAAPVRIETDVSVGFDDAATGVVDVRAVERRIDPRSGTDVVAGRLRSAFAQPVEDLVLAAIWRAPTGDETVAAGDIVAVVFRDVERVRPGVDARFEIPVAGRDVPDGPPDEVLVAL